MAGKVKFYRGEAGTSLPNQIQDGAVFIIERQGTNGLGDMYVDINNAKRLHIKSESDFKIYNNTMSGQLSSLGSVYVVTDENNNQIGIRVGDGSAYIGDLPLYDAQVYNIINNLNSTVSNLNNTVENKILHRKINAYLGTEYNALSNENRQIDGLNVPSNNDEASETLVLSRELWL